MCSLVMSLFSHDLHVMSLNTITIANSGLTYVHSAWFLDGKTSICSYLLTFRIFVLALVLSIANSIEY